MKKELSVGGEIRSAAWDLATRIRYLREEIKGGTLSQDYREELFRKEKQLFQLFNGVGVDTVKMELTVSDTMKANNESGWAFCRRVVIIENPLASAGDMGIVSVNLLPPGLSPDNLIEASPSEPLPAAFRS